MSTQSIRSIIIFLFCMAFIGSTSSYALPVDSKDNPIAKPQTTLENDLQKIAAKQQQINTLSGWITLSVDYKGENNYYEGAFLVKAPNQLHLEILDDLGQTHLRVIADGKKVYWWNAENNQSKILQQKPKVLKKIFKLPLSVDEFVAVLLNQISSREIEREQSHDKAFITLEFPQKIIRYSHQTYQINDLVVFKKKRKKMMLYSVTYDWPQTISLEDSNRYPKKLTWIFKKPQVNLEMEFQNIEINKNIPEEKFDFSRWSSKE